MAAVDAATDQAIQITSEKKGTPIGGMGRLPVVKQVGLMIGLAASVALGIMVYNWSSTPNYSPVYNNLTGKSAQEVVDALVAMQIPYKLNPTDGTVMVPSTEVHRARMKLAADGLPGHSMGMESVLMGEQDLGTSQFMERARYLRAQEVELARTIMTMTPVKSARVHLAVPKQSVFVRNRKQPSASVLIDLHSGRTLDKGQIGAIRHLVAASVPNLEPGQVSIVDDAGKLLSKPGDDELGMVNQSRYEFTRQREKDYQTRILDILTPILGEDRVQAEVTMEIDFTRVEQTSEQFNPDLQAKRSEQISEQMGGGIAAGVPGALTNQPPGVATVPEDGGTAPADASSQQSSSQRSSTTNYEVDRTVVHSVLPTASVRRVSVAVVVDDHKAVDADGAVTRTPLTPEEVEQISNLVKEAIAYNPQRGDRVRVINQKFMDPPAPEPVPEASILEQPWIWDVARQSAGVLGVLLLVFMVLRPAMKRLTDADVVVQEAQRAALAAGGGDGQPKQLTADGHAGGDGAEDSIEIPGNGNQEKQLETVKAIVDDDPGRAAQVVKNWMEDDG